MVIEKLQKRLWMFSPSGKPCTWTSVEICCEHRSIKPWLCIVSGHEATKAPKNRAVGFSLRLRLAREGTRLRVGPRKRTLEYVEEAEGYPLAGRATLAVQHAG